MSEDVLRVTRDGGRARVTLARPAVRNAFNAELIARLAEAFLTLGADPGVRLVVLDGEGPTFCGGADVNWMRAALDLDEADNVRDAEAMSDMLRAIDRCPKPVIARVQGGALGGGAGLCAVCDVVVAADDAIFGFTETKLGLVPAVISPFALAKVGVSQARRWFLNGARFDAAQAKAMGLVHEVVPAAELDAAVDAQARELESAGPAAVAAIKRLIVAVEAATYDESRTITARAIARQRVGAEGQEGLRAFLERRRPTWADR
ncbi:MAG TPA: enoyl-CoA hydratase-related protein [Candidatus Elarobacter sp.]